MPDLERSPEAPSVDEVSVEGLVEEGRTVIAEHVTVREPWHYDVILLFAAQAWMRECLPPEVCVNLAFTGGKSSGKTTATKLVTKLAGGRFYAGGSPAALRDSFGDGVVGLDEVDTAAKRDENLEGVLRVGNAWNATFPIKVSDGKGGWKTEEQNVGGPKVFNFRGAIDDALASRCYVVELPRQTDSRMVVANLFPDNPVLPFAEKFRKFVVERVAGVTKADVERKMKDPSFIERLDGLPPGLARSKQTAAILLIIGDLLGIPVDAAVIAATASQVESESGYTDVREWAADFYRLRVSAENGPYLETPQADLLGYFNARLQEAGRHPWAPNGQALTVALREIGFATAKKKSADGGKRYLRFDANVRKELGIPEPPSKEAANEAVRQPAPREARDDGSTITYPDGTVTDRRSGAVLAEGM